MKTPKSSALKPLSVEVTDPDLEKWIRPGDDVCWGQACAEPRMLTRLSSSQSPRLGISRFLGVTVAEAVVPTKPATWSSYCASARNRGSMADGQLRTVDADHARLPAMLGTSIDADVALLLFPPPRNGRYQLTLANECPSAAIDTARVVIAGISPHVPSIRGGTPLGPDQLDVIVHTNLRPTEMTQPGPDEGRVEYPMARNVAALRDDGATIQVGLGAPAAVVAQLRETNDLDVHSGFITDALANLMSWAS